VDSLYIIFAFLLILKEQNKEKKLLCANPFSVHILRLRLGKQKTTDMRRVGIEPHMFVAGQGPATSPGNNPKLWVQLGEETRNTNLAILETVQELKNEMA